MENSLTIADYQDALFILDVGIYKCSEKNCPCFIMNRMSDSKYFYRIPMQKKETDPEYETVYQCGDVDCDNYDLVACNIHFDKYLLRTEQDFVFCKECYDRIDLKEDADNYWNKEKGIHQQITTKKLKE